MISKERPRGGLNKRVIFFKEYPNYETAYYFYDECSRIIEMDEYNIGGKKLYKTTYSWDAEGNRLSEMQYNHGQSGNGNGNGNSGNNGNGNGNSGNIAGTVTTYTYDTLGNLVFEKTKDKVVDYQYNELNQLTKKKEDNESYSYTYDKRGNRTAETGKKESRSYLYDETNCMVEGTNWKGDKSAYTYNGLGLRVNNTQATHAGKEYARDYVIDYTSFENDDLMVFAEGNG